MTSLFVRFGLSYTDFSYGSLQISRNSTSKSTPINITVSFTLTNTGSLAGSETAQVYISPVKPKLDGSSVINIRVPTTPKWQLRGFHKAKDLKPGETRKVSVVLNKYAVSFWDVTLGDHELGGDKTGMWRVCEGVYDVAVGSSSADFKLLGTLEVGDGEGFVWEGL